MNIMPDTVKTGIKILPQEEKICILYPDEQKNSSVMPEKAEDRSTGVNMKLISVLIAVSLLLALALCVVRIINTGNLKDTLEENYWAAVDETTYSMYLVKFEDNTATMYYISLNSSEEIGSVSYNVENKNTIIMNGNTVTVSISTSEDGYTTLVTSPNLLNTNTQLVWYAVPPDVISSGDTTADTAQ